LYKIEGSGKLTPLVRVKADFLDKDPSLNQCLLARGILVTGGDDCIVRLFSIKDNQHTAIS